MIDPVLFREERFVPAVRQVLVIGNTLVREGVALGSEGRKLPLYLVLARSTFAVSGSAFSMSAFLGRLVPALGRDFRSLLKSERENRSNLFQGGITRISMS